MDNIYLIMIIALAILAIADLIVGVSNDAVNFLNSAVGSKAIPLKQILIVASIGIGLGVTFSSGLMEVARNGIFNPEQFVFKEVMIIFMAVMITDILVLDFFNTSGLPTSTTVSIVFELLGASIAISLIKISQQSESYNQLFNLINTSKALNIIVGIFLSVVLAFSVGAIVQWLTRYLLTFNYGKHPKWVASIFGGLALTALTYFIFIKGISGTPFANASIISILNNYTTIITIVALLVWFTISYISINLFKTNIYKLIVIVGTFGLALAFAGNDLVNFIGVPVAAWQAYELWLNSGVSATALNMASLSHVIETPAYMLLFSGGVMIATLWFSNKAYTVVKTSVDLANQSSQTKERFKPNWLSQNIVRVTINTFNSIGRALPKNVLNTIETRFKPFDNTSILKKEDIPAFDLVRAAVNVIVAAILISLATSLQLPLSTTYVTFMVAMGTSLADRAWGSESAVYRVAGVLNVVGGWFFTAFVALTVSAFIAFLLHWNTVIILPILLIVTVFIIVRNYIAYNKKNKALKKKTELEFLESKSVQGVIYESAENISSVLKRSAKIYDAVIIGLSKQDISLLKNNKKQINKLSSEIEDLQSNIYYFIKDLQSNSAEASNFYINIIDHLSNITDALQKISRISLKHVQNNHKKLTFIQIKDLRTVNEAIQEQLKNTQMIFNTESFEQIGEILAQSPSPKEVVVEKTQRQVERTQNEDASPKNTSLFLNVLIQSRDLTKAINELLEDYFNAHDTNIDLNNLKDLDVILEEE